MITCDFYLNNRIKTITGASMRTCWNTFKKDFGEAMSELCKVKVIYDSGTESHYSPKDFKVLALNKIDTFDQIDHLEKRALINDDRDNS